jgi:5-methylcytosine-specific restriction enzyme subunit McrC
LAVRWRKSRKRGGDRIATLPAWGEVVLDLDDEQAADLAGRRAVQVTPEGEGRWRVRAGSAVGVLVGDGWELRIRPALHVPRLMFLLAYAADQKGWKDIVAPFEKERDEVAAVASGFAWHAIRALERGPIRGYRRREERSDALRGRIRFADQIARGAGLPIPLEIAYSDYTPDVLENRMLLTAASLLLRIPRVAPSARRRLLHVRSQLEAVEYLRDWREARAPSATRLNEHYRPALALAELVLRSLSISQETGEIESTTFVFDMNKVFEDFVTAAFTEAMRKHGGTVRPQVGEYWLDEGEQLRLRPDIGWWDGTRCLAVLDAKYKAIDDGLLRHDDAYQMLAYCTAYGLDRGYLIYAQDSGLEPATHVVRNAQTELVVVALDVRQEPEVLLKQVERLADRVVTRVLRPVAA